MNNLIKSSLNSTSWTFLQTATLSILNFLQLFILLKYLTPKDFGEIAIMNIVYNLAIIVTTSGFGTVLITSKKKTKSFANKLFTINLISSLIISLILIIISNLIIQDNNPYSFFREYLIYYVIILIVNSFFIIPNSYLIRNFDHKKIAIAYIVSFSFSTISSIYFAINNYQAYAIIYSLLIQTIINTLIHVYFLPFKLKINFNLKSDFKELKRGFFLMGSQLISSTSNAINTYFISSKYSISALGIYNRAEKISMIPPGIFKSIVSNVLISSFTKLEEHQDYNKISNEIIKNIYNLYTPIIMVIFLLNHLIFETYFPNWIIITPYLKITLIGVLLLPLNGIIMTILKTKREGAYFIRNEIYKLIVTLTVITIVYIYDYSLIYLCFLFVLKNLLELSINFYKYNKVVNQRFCRFLKIFIPSIIIIISSLIIDSMSDVHKIIFSCILIFVSGYQVIKKLKNVYNF